MLCVECGKRDAKYDGLCEVCFLKKIKFTAVPAHIPLIVCPHCHSLKFGGRWEHMSPEDAIFRLVDRAIRFEHEYDSYNLQVEHGEINGEFKVEVKIIVNYKDMKIEESHKIKFDMKYESCPRCNKFFGNYFEAIVQLRGLRDYEIEGVADFFRDKIEYYATKNKNLFLTREVKKKEGLDFYLSDKREAKKIVKELSNTYGAAVKESPKIVGRRDGQDIYRVTYSIRLPNYRSGDIVMVDENYYFIESVDKSYIRGINIETWKKKMIDSKRHPVSLVREKYEIEEALVIFQDGDNAQLLDKSNSTLDIYVKMPLKEGSTVHIVRIDGEVYALPR